MSDNVTSFCCTTEVSPTRSAVELALFAYTDVQEAYMFYYNLELVLYITTTVTNALTVALIAFSPRLRVLSNLFFACLAVTDLAQGIFGVVYNIIRIHGFKNGSWNFVDVEVIYFLQVAWWIATNFSYSSLTLITLERWFFIIRPFLHMRIFSKKCMISAIAVCLSTACLTGTMYSFSASRDDNVSFAFPIIHTVFSVFIFATYAHIILVSYRQQQAIRALEARFIQASQQREALNDVVGVEGHAPNKTDAGEAGTVGSSNNGGPYEDKPCDHGVELIQSTDQDNGLRDPSLFVIELPPEIQPGSNKMSDTRDQTNLNRHAAKPGERQEYQPERAARSHENQQNKDVKKSNGVMAHNWRALRMSLTVFTMYFFTISPWIYYQTISSMLYGTGTYTGHVSQALNTWSIVHFCSNFFIYAFQNRDFRQVLGQTMTRAFGCCCPHTTNRVGNMSPIL